MTLLLLVAFRALAALTLRWALRGSASVMSDKEPRTISLQSPRDLSTNDILLLSIVLNASLNAHCGDTSHHSHDT